MSSTHIEITGTPTRLNGQLRAFVEQLQRTQDAARRMKATYDQAASGGDYEALRDALGLEQDAGGTADATAIYNLIGSVNNELNETNIIQLLGRLG